MIIQIEYNTKKRVIKVSIDGLLWYQESINPNKTPEEQILAAVEYLKKHHLDRTK